MIVPIPWVQVGMGLVTILVSVPLALGRVPMNRLYGIRIRKASGSQRNWMAINVHGGRLFLAFGLFLVAPLLGLLPVLLGINAFARRLPDA
jgi:hypothetical protein